jgi:hypothetical protein
MPGARKVMLPRSIPRSRAAVENGGAGLASQCCVRLIFLCRLGRSSFRIL